MLDIDPEDIRPLLPPPADQVPADRLAVLVEVALLRLEVACPSVEARVSTGVLPIELVHGGIADVITRVILNPDPGVRTSAITTGPFSSSATRVQGSDRITWTDADLEPLEPPERPLVGTARLGVEAWQVPG